MVFIFVSAKGGVAPAYKIIGRKVGSVKEKEVLECWSAGVLVCWCAGACCALINIQRERLRRVVI